MATTFVLISSQTLGGATASVTFSSIPQTYTDLYLLVSVRTARNASIDYLGLQFNSDTGSNYSILRMNGAPAPTSSNAVNTTPSFAMMVEANTSGSNFFGEAEVYIPNYTNLSNKGYGGWGGAPAMNSPSYMMSSGGLWAGTSAISSLLIKSDNAVNLSAGSTFYLYGIKKA